MKKLITIIGTLIFSPTAYSAQEMLDPVTLAEQTSSLEKASQSTINVETGKSKKKKKKKDKRLIISFDSEETSSEEQKKIIDIVKNGVETISKYLEVIEKYEGLGLIKGPSTIEEIQEEYHLPKSDIIEYFPEKIKYFEDIYNKAIKQFDNIHSKNRKVTFKEPLEEIREFIMDQDEMEKMHKSNKWKTRIPK